MPNYVLPSPPDSRDYPVSKVAPKIKMPDRVMLDDRFMKILDQAMCGVCVGKAGNAILSAGHSKALSSLYLYARCKELDGIPEMEGTYPRVVMKVMHQEGSCPERLLPYSDLRVCTIMPDLTPEMADAALSYRIDSYARCRGLSDIKQALANGHLVMLTILVADNFITYKQGVISAPKGVSHGYHAVVCCGYDDKLGAIRCLNSWGDTWGEDGFFWLDYEYFESKLWFVEAWAVRLEVEERLTWIDRLCRLVRKLTQTF